MFGRCFYDIDSERGFLRNIKHARYVPEEKTRPPFSLSIRVKVAAAVMALLIVYAVSLFLHDRQYTPFEEATYRVCMSLGFEIAYAGNYLERLAPSVENRSTGEVNRISYLAADHCVNQAEDLCLVMQGIDRPRRTQWDRIRNALQKLKEEVLEPLDVRSIDQPTTQALVALGEQLRKLGFGLLDDEAGAVRHKTYLDSDGSGVVIGVIIDGGRLAGAAERITELVEAFGA